MCVEKNYILTPFNLLKRNIVIFVWLLVIPNIALATHIVGGSLTYVHKGGSNYTITLKLYRDCGPNSVGYPASVNIKVLGYNGMPFSPSKDFNIPLTSVTTLSASLDPCAIPPNPLPCVQEVIYTKDVSNLPSNPGGYHLYFQICCRNGTILNITGPGGEGETYYATIPGTPVTDLYYETFTLPDGTASDNGSTAWSVLPSPILPNSARVESNAFTVYTQNNSTSIWSSQLINAASCGPTAKVDLRVDLSESSILEPGDSLSVFYSANGGPFTLFPVNGKLAGDFTSAVATATGIVGSDIKVLVRIKSDASSTNEIYKIDNVNVFCSSGNVVPNLSSPIFSLFPPLYICVNKQFTFDHKATDLDGDQLVYSLYHPAGMISSNSGGDNAPPPFANNSPVWSPVNHVAGYGPTNPLGSGPISIDPVTGILKGTPGTLGQFVVGVKVQEFRNGVYIGETLRDFQFNVVNCPQPPPGLAVPDTEVNDGCVATITATGISTVTATWNSIAPGAPGQYNNFLKCTSGCLSNTAATPPGVVPPPFVDFLVCGKSNDCVGAIICDTFRVFFNPSLNVNIFPSNPSLCFGQTSTTITAVGSGGKPPYKYLWNNINPSQTINVGVGTFNVQLSDASGCPPVFKSTVVTSFTAAASANAGSNQTKCKQFPLTTLNGTVGGATGGIWSGGLGLFSPNNTTLSNLTYSPTLSELAAGSVTLVLNTTGNGNCPASSASVTIRYNDFSGTPTQTVTNVSCFGGSNGSAIVGMTGGFSPYTFLWNTVPSEVGNSITNLKVGTFSYTATDNNGCKLQTSIIVTQPPLLSASSTFTNLNCSGVNNGIISVVPIGGVAPYTYSWSPGNQTTSSITGLASGSYSVKISDTRGCQTTLSNTITQPLPISISVTSINVSCFGGNNGVVNSLVTGGSFPYTYSWSPSGGSGPTASGLTAGTYTLIVRDRFSCANQVTVAITQPSIGLSAALSFTDESCSNLNNGLAGVIVSGGTPNYSYLWSPGSFTTSSISNLASGNYSLMVTDSKGCQTQKTVLIKEPAPLSIDFTNIISVSCFGGNSGRVSAAPSGGSPNYTYFWTPGNFTTSTISNLTAGSYSVRVTDSKSCFTSSLISISQPTAPLTAILTRSNVSCYKSSDGLVGAILLGGTPSYTYNWLPGNLKGNSILNAKAGTYTLTATDSKNCQTTSTISVTQPLPILPVVTGSNSTCNFNNGSGTVTVTGGLEPYSYLWTPTANTSTVITGLFAGTYGVDVTDSKGCIGHAELSINTSSAAVITIISTTNVSCYKGSDGAAIAIAVGGSGVLTYSWFPEGGNSLTAKGLKAGTYVLKVVDALGCESYSNYNPEIIEPEPISDNIVIRDVKCFSESTGSATITASGGTGSLDFKWLPSASTGSIISGLPSGNYSVEITDANNCSLKKTLSIKQPSAPLVTTISATMVSCYNAKDGALNASSTGGTNPFSYEWFPMNVENSLIKNLSAGIYTVQLIDKNNCILNSTITITEPLAPVTASVITIPVTCIGSADGIATINVSGGTPAYSYSWSPNISSTFSATSLPIGSYDITISDLNKCTSNVSLNIESAVAISVSLVPTAAACNLPNGSIISQVSGGQEPYSYFWVSGREVSKDVSGLSPGTYTLEVMDNLNCLTSATTSLTSIPLTKIDVFSVINDSCVGKNVGEAAINISSGTAPYQVNWLPYGGSNLKASLLGKGDYTVRAIDFNGCITTETLTISEPSPLMVSTTSLVNVSCFNGKNASISVVASGGTAPYQYSWSQNGVGQTISNLEANNYTVKVIDLNYCSEQFEFSVSQPTAALTSSISSINHPLCVNSTGDASVFVEGGTAPYYYNWNSNPPQKGNKVFDITAGNYSVSIIDNKGCITSNSVTLIKPSNVITTVGIGDTLCVGQTKTITASASGGFPNYTFAWQPLGVVNNGTLPISPIQNTKYTVMAFDRNGCAGNIDTIKVIVYDLKANNIFMSGVEKICLGESSLLSVDSRGNTGVVNFTWSNGLGSGTGPKVVSPKTKTTYYVIAKNYCAYTLRDSFIVKPSPLPTVLASSVGSINCVPGEVKFADLSVSNNPNDKIVYWLWDFGDGKISEEQNPSYTFNDPGTYTVNLSVKTDGGCSSVNGSNPLVMTFFPIPTASFSLQSNLLNIPFDKLVAKNLSVNASTYLWDFGDNTTSTDVDVKHEYKTVGDFKIELIAKSEKGCVDTSSVIIKTNADVVFPNAFTPNTDGPSGGYYIPNSYNNDIFFPYAAGVVDYKFQVFNRWGELIFETFDFKQGWDGYYREKICQQDVYVWKAYVKLNNGRVFNGTGDVTLLR